MSITLPNVKLRELIAGWKNNIRPVKEFFNKNYHDFPSDHKTAIKRIARNIDHFHSNYLCAVVFLVIIEIIATPALFAVVAISSALSIYVLRQDAERKIQMLGYEATVSTTYQLRIIGIASFFLFWLVGGTSALAWVVCLSVIFILAHAGTHNPDKTQLPTKTVVEDV